MPFKKFTQCALEFVRSLDLFHFAANARDFLQAKRMNLVRLQFGGGVIAHHEFVPRAAVGDRVDAGSGPAPRRCGP